MAEGAFQEPFILKSEHIRVLSSAQARYDAELTLRERLGYWRGIGQTIWITGAVALLTALVAFNFGIRVVQ